MLAKDNDSISDAASAVYRLSQEEMVRLQCEAREDYYRTQNDLKELMKRWDIKLAEQDATIKEQDVTIKEQNASIKERDAAIKKQDATIREKDATIEKYLAIMAEHGIQPE